MMTMGTIDTSNFNRAIKDLSRLSGVDLREVIRGEAIAILNQTIRNVAAEDVSKIDARVATGKLRPAQGVELKARRGLTKQSYAEIGRRLGLTLKVPSYAEKALVLGKKVDHKVTGTTKKGSNKEVIIITNDMRTATYSGARSALLKAINGRTGFFRQNLKAGVFKSVEKIAKKYKFMKVVGI